MTDSPFSTQIGAAGSMDPHDLVDERRLGQMAGAFADRAAVEAADPECVVYRAYQSGTDGTAEDLLVRTTTITPGTVGSEFHMTKGHHHVRDSGEFYYGMSGDGLVVMQDRSGQVVTEPMPPGSMVYVPPGWAHRSVNVGREDFVFLAVYFSDAGHDYAAIERSGFAVRVLATDDGYAVVPSNGIEASS